MRRLAAVAAVLALAACESPTGPKLTGDDPSAIVGHYSIASVNSLDAFPATLQEDPSFTLQYGQGGLILYADGRYWMQEYIYEITPQLSKGIPRVSTGLFALHGSTVEIRRESGASPEKFEIAGSGMLRVVQSVRDGRQADTLVFQRYTVLPAIR